MISKSVVSWQAMRARLPSCDPRLKKERHCDKVWSMTWLLLERKLVSEDGLLKKGQLRHIGSKKSSVVRLVLFFPMLRVLPLLYIIAPCWVCLPSRVRGGVLDFWPLMDRLCCMGIKLSTVCEHSSTLHWFFFKCCICMEKGIQNSFNHFVEQLFHEQSISRITQSLKKKKFIGLLSHVV